MSAVTTSTAIGHVLPGQRVAEAVSGVTAGDGVFERNGVLHAALAGTLVQSASPSGTQLSIRPLSSTDMDDTHSQLPSRRQYTQTVPAIGQEIVGRVVRLASKYAGVEILGVEGQLPLMESIKGTIRTQDIVDVEERNIPPIHMAFRPGDLVRARIIGIGDPSAGLLLSTGMHPELGVIHGKSAAAGAPLLPASWNEMVCSVTGIREQRKCAKPRSTQ